MCTPSAKTRVAGTNRLRMGEGVAVLAVAATAAGAAWVPSRSPRRVHVVWNRKRERRDTGSEGSEAGPVTASPPTRPAGGGPQHRATPLLAGGESGRCPCRAAIGLHCGWAVPRPRYHWPALELGGARAPATALSWRSFGAGDGLPRGLGADALEHTLPASFFGIFPP